MTAQLAGPLPSLAIVPQSLLVDVHQLGQRHVEPLCSQRDEGGERRDDLAALDLADVLATDAAPAGDALLRELVSGADLADRRGERAQLGVDGRRTAELLCGSRLLSTRYRRQNVSCRGYFPLSKGSGRRPDAAPTSGT